MQSVSSSADAASLDPYAVHTVFTCTDLHESNTWNDHARRVAVLSLCSVEVLCPLSLRTR